MKLNINIKYNIKNNLQLNKIYITINKLLLSIASIHCIQLIYLLIYDHQIYQINKTLIFDLSFNI